MNVGDIFYITFRKDYDPKLYRGKVEVILKNELKIHFRITGGQKEMLLEKVLFRKGNRWSVLSANFQLFSNSSVKDKMLQDIFKAIDEKTKEPM